MTATDKLFAGSIPEIYDGRLVPLIFEHYARDLAERVAATSPQHVLEIAAGTGALTSAITARLPAQSRIVATDLNQPMLDCAATRSDLQDRISWRQADALALPFEDQSFDVVACQFGVMFFPDKVKGSGRADTSSSMSGTGFPKTNLPTPSTTQWRRCCRTIRPHSWSARRTAIAMSEKSARS